MSAAPDYIAWKHEILSELAKICIAVAAFCWYILQEDEEEHENLIKNLHLPGLLNLETPEQKQGC
jgi:hypothetical protein